MSYDKPKVTIDLDEYLELKRQKEVAVDVLLPNRIILAFIKAANRASFVFGAVSSINNNSTKEAIIISGYFREVMEDLRLKGITINFNSNRPFSATNIDDISIDTRAGKEYMDRQEQVQRSVRSDLDMKQAQDRAMKDDIIPF